MLKKVVYILVFFINASVYLQAQGNKSVFGETPNSKLASMYKEEYGRKKEIRLDGKKYRIYNNYVTVGAGKCYNSLWNDVLFVPAADFNFHIKKTFYQIGGLLQGHSLYDNQMVQLHLCAGYRKESYKYFWAAYGGLSYTDGFYPAHYKDMNGQDSVGINAMKQVGLYAAFQAFYKLKFDYGIGLTVFGDINQMQYVVGARIELFFSSAFHGNIKHKDEEPE